MSNLNRSAVTVLPRYSNVALHKSSGSTYTPIALADFVARQIISVMDLPEYGEIRVLDPACGNGSLLVALINLLPSNILSRIIITGYDTDHSAIQAANLRLEKAFPDLNINLLNKDFLEHVLSLQDENEHSISSKEQNCFHLIIANPPYVRTQVMGAKETQRLAQSFGLSGRVDLYYPFLLGISRVLAKNGITGIITSNRFMTTKSGQAVRKALLNSFNVLHVWDMGDTKLFDAAVLPSVFLAKSLTDLPNLLTSPIAYSSIYETKDESSIESIDVIAALTAENNTVIEIADGRRFRVIHGVLNNGGDPTGIWRVATVAKDEWLATVETHTWDTFRRLGKIRVGVKSTADKVFVRNDWDDIPGGRPELLRPLITRKCARRFKAITPLNPKHRKEILYPHETTQYGRFAVELQLYPKSEAYLELHRKALESRKYLIDAGREWYELWVPHDPSKWALPKLVFPDISEKPVFWIDTDGGIVNGECYWIHCENPDDQNLMWLALAVANSSFIESFYDHKFNNKLYAGKRRFMTQYVELFPLPDPNTDKAAYIITLAKKIHVLLPSNETNKLEEELDAKIWDVFGLTNEKISG